MMIPTAWMLTTIVTRAGRAAGTPASRLEGHCRGPLRVKRRVEQLLAQHNHHDEHADAENRQLHEVALGDAENVPSR